jgi:hypothetical protein
LRARQQRPPLIVALSFTRCPTRPARNIGARFSDPGH